MSDVTFIVSGQSKGRAFAQLARPNSELYYLTEWSVISVVGHECTIVVTEVTVCPVTLAGLVYLYTSPQAQDSLILHPYAWLRLFCSWHYILPETSIVA